MRTPRCWTNKPLSRVFFVLILLSLLSSCFKKAPLLVDTVDTLEAEVPPIHVAYLKMSVDDKRHYNLESCFMSEPGFEFYSTPETYRILRERNISSSEIADQKSMKYFANFKDYDFLLISLPRGKTVLLRSFRFQTNEFVESFVPAKGFTCRQLYEWLGLVKVVSFPDNAYIFVNKEYKGRTPRWQALPAGEHQLRVETYEGILGQEKVVIPGPPEVVIKAPKSKEVTPGNFGELREDNKFSMAATAILAAAIAIAGLVLPILLLF